MSWRRVLIRFGAWAVFLLLVAALSMPGQALGGCQTAATGSIGVVSCTVYGVGVASRWSGPGVARNDCLYPWTRCTPIVVTSLDTGRSITVTPRQYCDCWIGHNGPNGETARIVDLDPATVAALGLNPAAGLYRVRVEPVAVMPDTSVR